MIRRVFLGAGAALAAVVAACTSGGAGGYWQDGGVDDTNADPDIGPYGAYGELELPGETDPIYGDEPRYGTAREGTRDPRSAARFFERLTGRRTG